MKQLAEAFGDRVFIAINDGMNGRPGVPYEESVVAAFEMPGFSCPKPMAFDPGPGPDFDWLPQRWAYPARYPATDQAVVRPLFSIARS